MINRAKCLQCESIIESHLPNEMIKCKCGLIAVCDGPAMRMWPTGSLHFVRIDEMGNEVRVKYVDKEAQEGKEENPPADNPKPTLDEAIEALERSIEYNEKLPYHEQYSFVTSNEMTAYLKSIVNIIRNL